MAAAAGPSCMPLRVERRAFKIGHEHRGKERVSVKTLARLSSGEAYKRTAAERAVDAFVRDNNVVGLGHGPLVVYAIEVIGRRLKEGILSGVTCLPSSDMASAEAAVQSVPLQDTNEEGLQADVTLIEADEVDCTGQGLSLVTGRAPSGSLGQQPQLPQLRSLISRSKECIGLLGSPHMVVRRLGGSLPVVISAEDWETTAEEIDDLFIGDAEVWRRSQDETATPRGGSNPYTSPDGHNILDIRFLSTLRLFGDNVPYKRIADEISGVHGVITHGLILDSVRTAVIADGPEAKIIEKGLLFGFKDEREK